MKKVLFLLCCILPFISIAQFDYEASDEHPFGLPNPEAPEQLLDFAPLIGECDCISITRKPDGSWAEPVDMVWRFKYIMNGKGIQDETLKADGKNSGSIRQFSKDSLQWYVHYYSSTTPTPVLSAWEGKKNKDGDIVLYRPQKAPNGMEGFYKINFTDISENGFKWLGEWVDTAETISYPTWKIDCTKKVQADRDADKTQILNNIGIFSKAYMALDYETLANLYTKNAKLFPMNTDIIEGREAIKERWKLPEGAKILHHKVQPTEIKFIGNYAYDYGYYQGQSQDPKGETSSWKGKYVIVWKKVNNTWKIYLDIWNRVKKQK